MLGDMIYGFITPIHILDVYFPQLEATNRTLCLFYYAGNNLAVAICNLNILFITIDRYVAIVHPFTYVRFGNSLPCLRWLIGVIWVYSLFASASHFIYNKWTEKCYCIMALTIQPILIEIFILPLIVFSAIVVVASYVHIYLIILRHKRQIQATIPSQVYIVEVNKMIHNYISIFSWHVTVQVLLMYSKHLSERACVF